MISTPGVLLDTGPVVALLDHADRYHESAKEVFRQVKIPLRTSESVVSEACFVLRSRLNFGPEAVFQLGSQGLFKVSFNLKEEWVRVGALLKKYRDVPISMADASLIRMAEIFNEPRILTFDSDFDIYRFHTNKRFENLLSF